MDNNLVERLSDATTALRRSFYFGVAFSLLSIYLLLDFQTPLPPSALRVKEATQERLAQLEPIYLVNASLRKDPTVLRQFFRFLEPFVAMDTAAEQAVAGVSHDDPRWLQLDPRERDLARSTRDNIQWLDHQIESYADVDLRDIPVFNVAEYYQWFVNPEPVFSSREATRRLRASVNVARVLGQDIAPPTTWPDSFFLHDFIARADLQELNRVLTAARKTNLAELKTAIEYLESFCGDNAIELCTYYDIRAELERGAFKIPSVDDVETIEINFFPGKIATNLFLLVSPMLLLASTFLGASQYYRRKILLRGLSSDPEWRAERDIPWLMTNIHIFSELPAVPRVTLSVVMGGLFVLGLTLPGIAQGLCLAFMVLHGVPGPMNSPWFVVGFLSTLLTLSAIFLMLKSELSSRS